MRGKCRRITIPMTLSPCISQNNDHCQSSANLPCGPFFIKGIDNAVTPDTITEVIISMTHKLNLSVVAEGIETTQQMEFLMSRDCDLGEVIISVARYRQHRFGNYWPRAFRPKIAP